MRLSKIYGILISTLIGLSVFQLWGNLKGTEGEIREIFFYHLRLPALVTAIFCGSLLSSSALSCQTYFRNPLATSNLLGISSAATLGAVIYIFFNGGQVFNSISLFLSSFLFAVFFTLLLLFVSSKINSILIFGILSSFFITAITSIFLHLSHSEKLKNFVQWTWGSFYQNELSNIPWMLLILLILLSSFFLFSKALNFLNLGEKKAQHEGLSIKKTQFQFLLLNCLSSGFVVSFAGPIAFVDIISPHIARYFLKTENHYRLFPITILVGANLCILADCIYQWLSTNYYQIPINPILSLLSAPVIFYLIVSKKRSHV